MKHPPESDRYVIVSPTGESLRWTRSDTEADAIGKLLPWPQAWEWAQEAGYRARRVRDYRRQSA